MKTVTKTILALGLMAAAPALADDNNNPAQVFERAASYQAVSAAQTMSWAQTSGKMTQNNSTAMFDTAYRADSSR